MAHAQRLLPIEQLLSEVALPAVGGSRAAGKPAVVPDVRRPEVSAANRSSNLSPFAADSARKAGGKPQLSVEETPASPVRVAAGGSSVPVVIGAAAPVAEREPEVAAANLSGLKLQSTQPEDLRNAVLNALNGAGQRMLASMLEGGEWQLEGNQLIIKVASSATVIDMSLGADAKRLMIATASGVVGRPMKLSVIPGGTAQSAPKNGAPSNGGGRSRAEQDPIVRRMKEKFGAEIRTIIDYREKR